MSEKKISIASAEESRTAYSQILHIVSTVNPICVKGKCF